MDKLSKYLVFICVTGPILWLFTTLLPLYAEWSGDAEREIQANIDAESCPGTQYQKIDGVVMCQCSDNEWQKPGKCEDKYK